MKALITGITGFVGKHLAKYLWQSGIEVVGVSRGWSRSPDVPYEIISLDHSNPNEMTAFFNQEQPDWIIHLSGMSSVKQSWTLVEQVFESNVQMTIRLLESILQSEIRTRVKVLTIGSSEEYGAVELSSLPITEETPLRPISPYGMTKASVSRLSEMYYKAHQLQVIHARPFNHIGPGQGLGFVTADFAKQVADIEAGRAEPVIKVGNLSSQRDFLDVRDVVSAYYHLMRKGRAGEVYNICSSTPKAISDVLDTFIQLSSKPISVQVDDHLFRPLDYPVYYGSNRKIVEDTGWKQEHSLEKSLEDILNHWRQA
jgi:GDP-4-dehydro-6-deoxy-D-mannose reductase